MRILTLGCLLLFASSFALASESIWIGEWVGNAKTNREDTSLTLRVFESNGELKGSISLPDVGVTGWPVSSIEASSKTLHIELPSDSGIQKMELVLEKESLTGKWVESGRKEPAIIYLKKATQDNRSIETRIQIDGPVGKIGASVFIPNQKGKFPGVVFLHGSGPQPRDSNRFAALRFAELGIASVIYDKRGVGESEGIFAGATFEGMAADAIAVAEYLRSQSSVSKVGFSGHSQGGWVSTLAASLWDHTAFVITSAGPPVTPAREAHWTVVRAMRNNGNSKSEVTEARKVIEDWHKGIRSGVWTEFERSYDKAVKQSWFKGSLLSDFAEKPSEGFKTYYKPFMDYRPIPAIKSLKIPYLAILTPDDESIDALETKEILEQLNKTNISIKLYPGYDHSMRRLGQNGARLRWPEHPKNYFADQYRFIFTSVNL